MSNTITAFFKGRIGVCESVYQHDYGLVLVLDGIDFGTSFEAYFEISGEEEAVPAIGQNDRVAIPNSCLANSGKVKVHIPIHSGENDSEVEYIVEFKVIGRAKPVDDGTPADQVAIAQAIAALQEAKRDIPEDLQAYYDSHIAPNIEGDVNDWLDDHPEATTTVQDGSLTETKFTDALKLKTIKDYVTPEMFGAIGNGTANDTPYVQACIDYAIANKKQITFIGNYKVEPIAQEDGTKVCLKIYRDSSDNSHINDTGISFNFIRESKIFTDSNEECSLLRINACNINIVNALFDGIEGKTTLIELSKINKLDENEIQWSSHNIFRNMLLLHSKEAIHLEGNTYYNTFDKVTIRYCTNGIVLDRTALEKAGISQGSNVNRNDFNNIVIHHCSGKSVAIYYGDTNKFINVSLEGCVDGIYVDDPQRHASDFPIQPRWYTEANMFVNLVVEAITGIPFYNNSGGLKVINTTIRYEDPNNVFSVPPQTYIGGGANAQNSAELVMNIYKTLEEAPISGMQKYSTVIVNPNGAVSNYYSDYEVLDGGAHKVLSRRNLLFDESKIVNIKADTSLIYERDSKCFTKQIGGITYLSSKFGINPQNLSQPIDLLLEDEIKPHNQMYSWGVLPTISVPVYVNTNNSNTLVECQIYADRLRLVPPTGGWSSYIIVWLNLHWFRGELPF